MSLKQFFESLTDKLYGGAGVKSVYGDPIETQGKTIIPVSKVVYGFGGGYGGKLDEKEGESEKEGGGAGAGLAAKPVGIFEVTEDNTRFIPAGSAKKLAGAMAITFILGFLIGRR